MGDTPSSVFAFEPAWGNLMPVEEIPDGDPSPPSSPMLPPQTPAAAPPLPYDTFMKLPPELLLDIMVFMVPADLERFILASEYIRAVFEKRRHGVMVELLRGRADFPLLLNLHTARGVDSIHTPRNTAMMMERPLTINHHDVDFAFSHGHRTKSRVRISWAGEDMPEPRRARLEQLDIECLWSYAAAVDWWVDQYPSMRWHDAPEDRRCLSPAEERRLQQAVARWWLYAYFFHGTGSRNRFAPRIWDKTDLRLQIVRRFTTREVLELQDLWKTLRDCVGRDLCSSPPRQQSVDSSLSLGTEQPELGGGGGGGGGGGYADAPRDGLLPDTADAAEPWGSPAQHRKIVNTYQKLNPEQLRTLMVHWRGRRRQDIVRAVRLETRGTDFAGDQETLTQALYVVLDERSLKTPRRIRLLKAGILDEDSPTAEAAAASPWSTDASPDGRPPAVTSHTVRWIPGPRRPLVPGHDGGTDCYGRER